MKIQLAFPRLVENHSTEGTWQPPANYKLAAFLSHNDAQAEHTHTSLNKSFELLLQFKYTHTHTLSHTHSDRHACTHAHTHSDKQTNRHTSSLLDSWPALVVLHQQTQRLETIALHTCTRTLIQTDTHTYMHIHTHTRTYTYQHTHIKATTVSLALLGNYKTLLFLLSLHSMP